MTLSPFRQIFYTSRCVPGVDVDQIVQHSRHNNAVDGITGLLWYNDGIFLQVIEGPESSVASTYARIAKDPRHDALTILSDRPVEAREFGYWSMERAERGSADSDALLARLERRLNNAPDAVRQAFTAAAFR
ncbi:MULTISPECIES: BLUF domain-containing protein [unclassified Sphingomonas]|uniref:BLUF domain-containing protein n=1 Tax=unclassified Sphingomonas TaxID=196159 RepID=UPI000AC8F498|nr:MULTISPECIES: BLUF domain-containing protein [unclassified Sphingomonas]